MEMDDYIPITVFCNNQGVETKIINSLQDFGLLEVTIINEASYIHLNQLAEAERVLRLLSDLEINMEGIDVITHLLKRIHGMQLEIMQLKNKLRLYED